MMEDFIERTLRERRSLQHALVDLVVKYDRIPSGSERSMLERMIEVLKEEIALRRGSLRAAHLKDPIGRRRSSIAFAPPNQFCGNFLDFGAFCPAFSLFECDFSH